MIARWLRSKEYAEIDIRPEGSERILPFCGIFTNT